MQLEVLHLEAGVLVDLLALKTTWKPDTCLCIIIIPSGKFVKRCSIHQRARYQDVINHNTDVRWRGKQNEKETERQRIKRM